MKPPHPSQPSPVKTAALPFEVDAAQLPPLGMPPADFLRDYWQKRPLLIRNAFPGFVSPHRAGRPRRPGLRRSRAVAADRARPQRRCAGWCATGRSTKSCSRSSATTTGPCWCRTSTSGMPTSRALLPAFGFLPRWRIDDVMGQLRRDRRFGRRARRPVRRVPAAGARAIAAGRSTPRRDGRSAASRSATTSNSSCCASSRPTHDWVLEPGDMLYLPPGVPHHGVAEDACLTFSVGMRAPVARLSCWATSSTRSPPSAGRIAALRRSRPRRPRRSERDRRRRDGRASSPRSTRCA